MIFTHNAGEEIGEQGGSLRPLAKYYLRTYRVGFIAFMLVVGALSPLTSSAASLNYLRDNAPGFIDKIQSEYGEMVNVAALLQDYDQKLILAVIVVESEGNEGATSQRGAQGLMQLMPQTAKALGVKDAKEPFQNILAGTKYLKQLEDSYGFNSPEEALVAYNMGPSRAKRWLSEYQADDYVYVKKVMYVYGVLVESEKSDKQIAKRAAARLAEVAKLGSHPAPLLTRPRDLSLAAFPMTLPSTRRTQLEFGQ